MRCEELHQANQTASLGDQAGRARQPNKTAAPTNQVGANRSGAELGAKIYGAEPASRLSHASSHINATHKIILYLGANDSGTEMCNLDVTSLGSRK
jgi:hypothetical protein